MVLYRNISNTRPPYFLTLLPCITSFGVQRVSVFVLIEERKMAAGIDREGSVLKEADSHEYFYACEGDSDL